MTSEIKPGITQQELKQWRIENWTKEELAQELMVTSLNYQRLINEHNQLKTEVLGLTYKIQRLLKDS